IELIMTLMENRFFLNTRIFNKGSFTRVSRHINNIHARRPVLPKRIVFQLVKPHEGASLNINNKAKLQYNTSMSPDTSRLGFRAEAFIGISRMASIMDTNANGIL